MSEQQDRYNMRNWFWLTGFVIWSGWINFSAAGTLSLLNADGTPNTTQPTITLPLPVNNALGNPQTTAAGVVSFSTARISTQESAFATMVVVTRSGGLGPVKVDYLTLDGTATSGSDFSPIRGTLTWENGDTSVRTLLIGMKDDRTIEPTEAFTLCLTNPQNGVVIGQGSVIVDIFDNDSDSNNNRPPLADFTVSQTIGVAPLGIEVDASASRDSETEGVITNYHWRASDGQVANGQRASLLFSEAGEYEIALSVTDDRGATGVKAQRVTVLDTFPFCDEKMCNYLVDLNRAGFYVATVRLAHLGKAGVWGLSVSTETERNVGGFNAGATLPAASNFPGFIAFALSRQESLDLTPFEYLGGVLELGIKIQQQFISNGERITVYDSPRVPSGQRVTTPPLDAGFYVLEAYGNPLTQRSRVGVSINAGHLSGSINVGGWIDDVQRQEGFGAFFVDKPQQASIQVLYGKSYGEVGADQPYLDIFYQNTDGSRTLYWTSTPP